MEKDDKNWIALGVVLIILMLTSLTTTASTNPTKEEVKAYIEECEIQHADKVLRQAMFETGWLKCTSCSREVNNLFGFLWKGHYLKFDTWQKSVEYYKWWQDQLYKGGDYYVFLEKVGYATAPNYIRELKRMW